MTPATTRRLRTETRQLHVGRFVDSECSLVVYSRQRINHYYLLSSCLYLLAIILYCIIRLRRT